MRRVLLAGLVCVLVGVAVPGSVSAGCWWRVLRDGTVIRECR